ncbi:DUF2090 domain-containing protein [Patescibacteria group bacterium]|nr:DUF2090 domain-containing protein [Patescibacteria group bacterium]
MSKSVFTKNDAYLMLALDHRGSFEKLLPNADASELISIKKELISSVFDQMSGVLIDFDYGLPAYYGLAPTIPKPFLLPIENSGYSGSDDARINTLEKSVSQIQDAGAAGVKLLIYFNSSNTVASAQIETARQVLNDAHAAKLPLFLEIVTYGANTSVLESVEMFLKNDIKPDVFKLEYPGSLEACTAITSTLAAYSIPWILLTRGGVFDVFHEHLKIAKAGGCVGFLAGRALWEDGVILSSPERARFFSNTLKERFQKINEVFN